MLVAPPLPTERRAVLVVDLAASPEVQPPGLPSGTDAEPDSAVPAAEQARLPLGRLSGLAGSGAFAVWTSLTCFVC